MNCSNCGAQLPEGIKFCTSCGSPVADNVNTTQQMQINYSQPTPASQTMQPNYTQQMPGVQPVQANYGVQTGYPNQQQVAPKPPKKPLPKALKMGLIIGIPVVVLLVVFFVVLLPMLLKADLKGEYKFKDKKADVVYTITFDEGSYIMYVKDDYYDNELIVTAGTYEYDKKDGEIVMTDLSGDEIEAEFDAKENIVEIDRDEFEISDKKATMDVSFSDNYAKDLYDKVEPIVEDILANDEDAYDDAYWYDTYRISGYDMDEPFDKFLEALVDKLDYENDDILQELMVGNEYEAYLTIYVHVGYSPDDYEVEIRFNNDYSYEYR